MSISYNIKYLHLLQILREKTIQILSSREQNAERLYPIIEINYETTDDEILNIIEEINEILQTINNINRNQKLVYNINKNCLQLLNIIINILLKINMILKMYEENTDNPLFNSFLKKLKKIYENQETNFDHYLNVFRQSAGNPIVIYRNKKNIEIIDNIIDNLLHNIELLFQHYELYNSKLVQLNNMFLRESIYKIIYYTVCFDICIIEEKLLDSDENNSLFFVEEKLTPSYIKNRLKIELPIVYSKMASPTLYTRQSA